MRRRSEKFHFQGDFPYDGFRGNFLAGRLYPSGYYGVYFIGLTWQTEKGGRLYSPKAE